MTVRGVQAAEKRLHYERECQPTSAVSARSGAHGRSSLDTAENLARSVADLALDRKALDVVVIDLREHSSYADFLVIASGTSDRHVQSIAEHVQGELAKANTHALGSEGLREGQWALVDFGSVVLHVFHQYTREVYDLEEIWRPAPRLRLAAPAVGATSRLR